MADCSDFKVFKEEMDRMCQSLEAQLCPLKHGSVTWFCDECEGMCFQNTDFAIRTVQKRSDEHPKKTRQSEFLKLFPNAQMERRHLAFCPKLFDTTSICIKDGSGGCRVCIEKYWSEEVE